MEINKKTITHDLSNDLMNKDIAKIKDYIYYNC